MKGAGALTIGAALSPLAPRMAWSSTPTIKMAYILSDHHAPLLLAASNPEMFEEKYKTWLKPLNPGKLYDLYDNGSSIARVQLIPTKKGPDVEKLVAQGSVDIAISGTQAILMSVDKGVDTKIISPLQTAGNVFVLNKKVPAQDWKTFVTYVKGQGKQFKIGMPGPHTVAAIIFRSALDHEGVTYTEDATNKKADILFINMKGHGNLISALNNNISQGIIGAQPFPSVTIDQGVGRLILNLQDVPPAKRWAGHACCSLEATSKFLTQDPALAGKVLSLLAMGVDMANTRKDLTAKACSAWLGVKESVETVAMQSMTYTTTADSRWIESVDEYAKTMDGMGMFTGELKGVQGKALAAKTFDFSMMNDTTRKLKSKGLIA